MREKVSLVRFKWLATCRLRLGSSIVPPAAGGVEQVSGDAAGGVAQHDVFQQSDQVLHPKRHAGHHAQAQLVILQGPCGRRLAGNRRRSEGSMASALAGSRTRRSPPPRQRCCPGRRCAARVPSARTGLEHADHPLADHEHAPDTCPPGGRSSVPCWNLHSRAMYGQPLEPRGGRPRRACIPAGYRRRSAARRAFLSLLLGRLDPDQGLAFASPLL